MTPIRMHTPNTVEVVQVIRVVACRGAGTQEDPIRNVTQHWSFDGTLLAERDPHEDSKRGLE